ncbi:MAG: class I SAM-dependent methyltransferase [Deferrisomatales bacterium]|nr:class I SAM-dependent methyltransferase [Deferrisomatales bacterium]
MGSREVLFRTYAYTHLDKLDADEAGKLSWFRAYLKFAYVPHLSPFERGRSRVLDVGCSAGYLLRAFHEEGFQELHGIDLSPEDVGRAVDRTPGAQVVCGEAREYLLAHPKYFDVIVAKAILEHTEKDHCLAFLQALRSALREGGVALVDVPNMDWLFSPHERYMDFTHEVGFTQESLSQVMRNVFDRVEVVPVVFSAMRSPLGRLRRRLARRLLGTLLTWAEPEVRTNPIWARSLLAVGRDGGNEGLG